MDIKNLDGVPAFITKDGSDIRELLAYRNSAIRQQSLAEARVPVGGCTAEHYHARTEEIYFVTAGRGRIRIEAEEPTSGRVTPSPFCRARSTSCGTGPALRRGFRASRSCSCPTERGQSCPPHGHLDRKVRTRLSALRYQQLRDAPARIWDRRLWLRG